MAKDIRFPEEQRLDAILRQMRAKYCANCTKSDLFCREFCACRPEKAYPAIDQGAIVENAASHAAVKIF